jgi:predicted AlkP superfamily pyrophosphatase or phosphodiesterase
MTSIGLRAFVLALGFLCSSCTTDAQKSVATAPVSGPGEIVVMISVDGLAGFYLDDPRASMPTIRALAGEGVSARMTAVNPTVTWPNHVTLVTGVRPARHGVVGNNYFDRATGKAVTLIADPVFDQSEIVKVPTIYDVAKRGGGAGMTTAAVNWPASRNAKTLDWTIPDVHDVGLYEKYSTASLLSECAEAGIPSPLKAKEKVDLQVMKDETNTRIFNFILRKHRPRLALLHLVNVDHMQHLKGPRTAEAYAAIAKADGQVRDVWEELKRDFPGKATLVVLSDHGFSPIEHAIFPNVVLRKAGLVQVKGTRVVGGDVTVLPQGGCGMIYFATTADPEQTSARVVKAFAGVKGIRKVVTRAALGAYGLPDPKVDPHGPDMLVLAEEGYVFGDTAAGELPFIEKPERSGSHGHDASIPDLRATFVVWGAGVRHAGDLGSIQNVDVAPTLAKLLGVEMVGVEGKAVAGVMD